MEPKLRAHVKSFTEWNGPRQDDAVMAEVIGAVGLGTQALGVLWKASRIVVQDIHQYQSIGQNCISCKSISADVRRDSRNGETTGESGKANPSTSCDIYGVMKDGTTYLLPPSQPSNRYLSREIQDTFQVPD
jgi:hypothetical protein